MSKQDPNLEERLRKLGISSESRAGSDTIPPAIAALACFPMYLVANATGLAQPDGSTDLKDLFHISEVREAFAIGEHESRFSIADQDAASLHAMLSFCRPADIIIYEFALETLADVLSAASPGVAEALRVAVARSVLAIANASGDGWFGSGAEPSDDQRRMMRLVFEYLELHRSEQANELLQPVIAA